MSMRNAANSLIALAGILAATPLGAQAPAGSANDPVAILAGRLDLARYKATIKGLTKFGDRRQGTDRNANAVTWIEQQLKSYGCSDVERIVYDYQPAAPKNTPRDSAARAGAIAQQRANQGFGSRVGGSRMRGTRARTG